MLSFLGGLGDKIQTITLWWSRDKNCCQMYFHMYWYLLVHDSYNHGKVFNKKQLEFKVCNLISGMLKRKFSEDEETSLGDNIVRLPT